MKLQNNKRFLRTQKIRSRLEVRPMYAKIICMSRGKHVAILLQNLTTMKELTALQDKDKGKDKGLGLGKYNSAAQSITPSYIYMVVKLSLSLCPGLFSFDNHIIIQLAFFIS